MIYTLFLDPAALDLSRRIQPPSSKMLENSDETSDQFVWHEGKLYRLIGMHKSEVVAKVNNVYLGTEWPVYIPAKTPFNPEIYASYYAERTKLQDPSALQLSGKTPLQCLEEEAEKDDSGALYLLAMSSKEERKNTYMWRIGVIQKKYPFYYFELGRQAESQRVDPTGEIRDLAISNYEEAATQNHMFATYRLGMLAIKKGEYKKASDSFKTAAGKGYPSARYELGRLYEEGKGIRQSDTDALDWYLAAAEQGHSEAKFRFYRLFTLRQPNLPNRYLQKSLQYMEELAKSGNFDAQFSYGVRKEEMTGISRPEWIEKAADQGHLSARCLFIQWYIAKLNWLDVIEPMEVKVADWISAIREALPGVQPRHTNIIRLIERTLDAVTQYKRKRSGIAESAQQALDEGVFPVSPTGPSAESERKNGEIIEEASV